MVVVRGPPNAAGTEDQNSENPHQDVGEVGMRQNRLVLLIMGKDKKTQIEESGQKTAEYLARGREVPESSHEGDRQKQRGGQKIRPTPRWRISREKFCGQYDLFSRSHAGSPFPRSHNPFSCAHSDSIRSLFSTSKTCGLALTSSNTLFV